MQTETMLRIGIWGEKLSMENNWWALVIFRVTWRYNTSKSCYDDDGGVDGGGGFNVTAAADDDDDYDAGGVGVVEVVVVVICCVHTYTKSV